MHTFRFGRFVDAPTAPAMTLRRRRLTFCVASVKTPMRSKAEMLLLFLRVWVRAGFNGAAEIACKSSGAIN